MTPEERLAAKLIKKQKLTPPIPIEDLLSEFADIEYDQLPAGSDAVLLRKQIKKNHPLVIIDRSKPPKRRRFTLAHELGHILIPWHIGTMSCHTLWTGEFGESLYRSTEAEANRFASELLMPAAWMNQIIAKHDDITDIYRDVLQADVSTVSAGISLCKVLPAGFVFVAADANNNVIASARSTNTAAPLMDRETRCDTTLYRGTGAKCVKTTSGSTSTYWWDFRAAATLINSEDRRTTSELLTEIVENMVDANVRIATKRTIHGIIAAANGSRKPSDVKSFVSVLRQLFVGREPDVLACATHQDFDLFLLRRAEELIAKRVAPNDSDG